MQMFLTFISRLPQTVGLQQAGPYFVQPCFVIASVGVNVPFLNSSFPDIVCISSLFPTYRCLRKFLFCGATTLLRPSPPLYWCFDITLGRNPLDGGSDLRRDLYLTTHTVYKRQTSMPPAGFEREIPADERPQTYALDRSATGIGASEQQFSF